MAGGGQREEATAGNAFSGYGLDEVISARFPLLLLMLTRLREATGAAHERLDAAFGSLHLQSRADYVRFLCGHALGLTFTFPVYRAFVRDTLDMLVPDYDAMIAADLFALGIDAGTLPAPAPDEADAAALADPAAAPGIAYVLAGSRLGVTGIARQPNWGNANDLPSGYLADRAGLDVWRELAAWLKQDRGHDAAEAAVCGAMTAFALFERGFHTAPAPGAYPEPAANG